jgi:2Fe-2S ferredoxin
MVHPWRGGRSPPVDFSLSAPHSGPNFGWEIKMPHLTVVKRDGSSQAIEARDGFTVMEAIRENGISELLGICGGCCSCATCHVFVDQAFVDKLPPMKGDESDLLDSSAHRQPTSRLACQVPIRPDMDGMVVTIAPED